MKGDIKRLIREPWLLATIIFVAFLLFVFIVVPIWKVFAASLYIDGHLSAQNYIDVFLAPYMRTPFMNSIILGLIVAAAGTTIGFLIAYAVVRANIPFKKTFETISSIPIVSTPFVIALAAVILFGKSGFITRTLFGGEPLFQVYGLPGLVLVETLAYFPTAYLVLKGVLEAIPVTYEEAAKNLGASRPATFWRVVFPLTLPGVAAAFLLLFIESLADFGNPLILSGQFPVLATQAYLQITAMYDTGGGATLAIMLLVPSMIAYSIHRYVIGRRSFVTVTGKVSRKVERHSGLFGKTYLTIIALFVSALIILFYGSLFVGAFVKLWGVDYSFTLTNFTKVMSLGGQYVIDSVILALIAMPLTGIIGLVIAYFVTRKRFPGRKLMEFVSLLAFAVPGTVIGIGYIMAFNQTHWYMPWVLQGTSFIILAMFAFRNMPVGMQAGMASLSQVDPSIEEAARSLGAGNFTVFRKIVIPMIIPAFLSGLISSFVRAMTQVSAVIFVVSGGWNLLTVFILGLVENGELSLAAAMSLVLVIIVLIALGSLKYIVHRLETRTLVKAAW